MIARTSYAYKGRKIEERDSFFALREVVAHQEMQGHVLMAYLRAV